MSTMSIARPNRDLRASLLGWSVASMLVCAVVGAGLVSSTPLPVFGWAAAFLFFAVASDVASRRVPNLLTFPALLAALAASPWFGASGGPLPAAFGMGVGFALLIGPYAVGGVGAGDVKALMVLGAWLGAPTILGATAWAMIAAGTFGIAHLALQGELRSFAARWVRIVAALLRQRRIAYEAPAAGSSAAGGIPFAAAIAVGLAAQLYGGTPW